ncbi:hypothetical protein [Roseateles amylovorans]|uniref:ABC transporter permease n=1 Tax=Roseateles amylovorans TaxID=2978473 RepID=A0ABY6AXS4_9BURK|nr:hypothetical protein [Roseateles amylovorans]UXH77981.1 hypothetical protein N4261_23985 [Roseateles amylovorans]
MTIFKTLLLREWLQYKWVWCGLVGACLLLMGLAVSVSTMNEVDLPTPEPIMLIVAGVTLGVVMTVVILAAAWQLMLVPRRDQQDRSIEYWASLPGSHASSLLAPIVAHGVLMPIGALVAAIVIGAPLGVWMAVRELGAEALQQMQWSPLILAWAWMSMRLLLGMVLAALWLAPIMLFLMAAAAWLRIWGAALVVVVLQIFTRLYDITLFKSVMAAQLDGVRIAFAASSQGTTIHASDDQPFAMEQFYEVLFKIPQWAPADMVHALQHAAGVQFIGGLIFAGLCFWLLVLQRKRSL